MRPIPATASRRPPWQNPRRRRQAAAGVGVLLLGCFVLALLSFWSRGPQPASPVAGIEPGRPTQNLPAIPRTASPSSGTTPTAVPTQLPTAIKPGETLLPTGLTTTGYPAITGGTPTPQVVDTTGPTTVVTERPPTVPPTAPTTVPSAHPSSRPTSVPSERPTTSTPTEPPPTSSTPTSPPTTPDDPDQPGGGGLGGLLGGLLDKLGL
ncbi:hypothetical protein ACQPYH_41470 [Kribbella sp. CA-245084]|uniref:hypothetical protein n=1 Tax=Kribbella sp. CA-245084 TaxID=3239940 RepID=UPI003D8B88A7